MFRNKKKIIDLKLLKEFWLVFVFNYMFYKKKKKNYMFYNVVVK